MNSDNKFELHPPHVMFYNYLVSFFSKDPTIVVSELDNATRSVTIYVSTSAQKEALKQLLRDEPDTGGLQIFIDYLPQRGEDTQSNEKLLGDLCENNPLFAEVFEGTRFQAACFRPEVVDVFTDDFFSPNGHVAMTAADVARRLFKSVNIQTKLY